MRALWISEAISGYFDKELFYYFLFWSARKNVTVNVRNDMV